MRLKNLYWLWFDPFAGMTIVEKIERILITAVAVVSLFASAVSACNCPHHEHRTDNETPSCHTHSLAGEDVSQQTNVSSKKLDSPCECFFVKPAPGAIAKPDNRCFRPQPDAISTEIAVALFDRRVVVSAVSPVVESDLSAYSSKRPTGLLPARAPPRL
ncbi:MAG: hypothetical protein ACRD43_02170 [Pyrinomonadaceae bacterium]